MEAYIQSLDVYDGYAKGECWFHNDRKFHAAWDLGVKRKHVVV